ncbi:MAG: NADH:ubiquinone oxidoreductase subunit N, partial [Xanthomonadales bacterium]|nr:NADH:ubiquinone oxidoreductase subunit N [Xanthomonadales bacterium]
MNGAQMLLAAPEFWVLIMTCVVMIVDLFLTEQRRGIIHMLAIVTVVFAAIITLRGDYLAEGMISATAFNGSFIRDPMGDVLKVFSFVIMGLIFTYAKFYLRTFKLFRGDFYTLSLFALLGVMLLISANSMLMIYLGLELVSLSVYALVAFDRESGKGSESAMKYFVLGSMASGMLLFGMSMIYGATGSLGIPEIADAIRISGTDDILLIFGLVFVVVGIAFKFGVVPFHMWIPDVYEG